MMRRASRVPARLVDISVMVMECLVHLAPSGAVNLADCGEWAGSKCSHDGGYQICGGSKADAQPVDEAQDEGWFDEVYRVAGIGVNFGLWVYAGLMRWNVLLAMNFHIGNTFGPNVVQYSFIIIILAVIPGSLPGAFRRVFFGTKVFFGTEVFFDMMTSMHQVEATCQGRVPWVIIRDLAIGIAMGVLPTWDQTHPPNHLTPYPSFMICWIPRMMEEDIEDAIPTHVPLPTISNISSV
ncbi:hypothetical protein BU15DRAFT_64767 [Melanogaster broomeanus]|nr:hypothetical protein BU15DRAFT_64767 [Melanogaster broomeanus]